MRISFIGGGVMAETMIRGILNSKLSNPSEIKVAEPVEVRRTDLMQKHLVKVFQKNAEVIEDTKIIVLSVKPQNLSEVMTELKSELDKTSLLISIVAGAQMKTLSQGLNHSSVVRAMPNTPAQIGEGMTVWTTSQTVSKDDIASTEKILGTLGEQIQVKEEKLVDMATAVSASGPAYVFLFIEALIDSGVYLGMPREMAEKLVLQTVLGSTNMARTTGKTPNDLRTMVTSPGGTTAEALMSFEKNGFKGIIQQAVAAAYQKSKSLAKIID